MIDAFRKGDPLARSLVEEAAHALIVGISGMVNLVNPARIIFGGGITEGLPEVAEWVDEGIRHRALASATRHLDVAAAELGNRAGVVGAAALALRSFA